VKLHDYNPAIIYLEPPSDQNRQSQLPLIHKVEKIAQIIDYIDS
jgi:hypothetical protein